MCTEKTIPALITNRTKKYQSKILFQRRDGWSWKQITWLDFERDVKGMASFLMDLGFQPGDASLVLSPNRMESLLTETAVSFTGGVTIPIGEKECSENMEELLMGSKVKFIFTDDGSTASRILNLFDRISGLKKIIVFSSNDLGKDDRIIPYAGVLKLGLLKRKQLEDRLVKTSQDVLSDSPAAVFHGSNSDGQGNKKKEVTHLGLIEALDHAARRFPFIGEEDQSFSYLPAASPFEKFINYLAVYMGSRIVMAETREDLFEDILEVKPTVLFQTKSVLENMCSSLLSGPDMKLAGKKLKADLGNRVKYVLTDSLPQDRIKNLFLESGVSIIEVPELDKLGVT